MFIRVIDCVRRDLFLGSVSLKIVVLMDVCDMVGSLEGGLFYVRLILFFCLIDRLC